MSGKNKKQIGVWIDSQHATVVGRANGDSGEFVILAHEQSDRHQHSSSESITHHAEIDSLRKLFKNISAHMENTDEVYVTGTGVAQEQFIHFLAEEPQFKNIITKEGTSNRMTDDALIAHMTQEFK